MTRLEEIEGVLKTEIKKEVIEVPGYIKDVQGFILCKEFNCGGIKLEHRKEIMQMNEYFLFCF